MLGLNGETIWWNHEELRDRPWEEYLEFPRFFGGKVGWGFICSTRLRITPQLSVVYFNVDGDWEEYAVQGGIGVRADFVLAKHFGVAITPEYCVPLNKSYKLEKSSTVSSIVNGWSSGFNCSLGFYIFI